MFRANASANIMFIHVGHGKAYREVAVSSREEW